MAEVAWDAEITARRRCKSNNCGRAPSGRKLAKGVVAPGALLCCKCGATAHLGARATRPVSIAEFGSPEAAPALQVHPLLLLLHLWHHGATPSPASAAGSDPTPLACTPAMPASLLNCLGRHLLAGSPPAAACSFSRALSSPKAAKALSPSPFACRPGLLSYLGPSPAPWRAPAFTSPPPGPACPGGSTSSSPASSSSTSPSRREARAQQAQHARHAHGSTDCWHMLRLPACQLVCMSAPHAAVPTQQCGGCLAGAACRASLCSPACASLGWHHLLLPLPPHLHTTPAHPAIFTLTPCRRLPLYSLDVQMGSDFKQHMLPRGVREKLLRIAQVRKGVDIGASSTGIACPSSNEWCCACWV